MCKKTLSHEDAIRYFPELVFLGVNPTDISSDAEYRKIISEAKANGKLPKVLPRLK
jgi:hypothetical protein